MATEQTCPKCHSKRFGKAEFCVCGHKWFDTKAADDFLREIGIDMGVEDILKGVV